MSKLSSNEYATLEKVRDGLEIYADGLFSEIANALHFESGDVTPEQYAAIESAENVIIGVLVEYITNNR